MSNYFSETAVECTASYLVYMIWCSRWFCCPYPHLMQCIALFVVDEGLLLLDIGWFVLFLCKAVLKNIQYYRRNSNFPIEWHGEMDLVHADKDANQLIYLRWRHLAPLSVRHIGFYWEKVPLRHQWGILNYIVTGIGDNPKWEQGESTNFIQNSGPLTSNIS